MIRELTDLLIGAPVVHEDHGVGRYRGLTTLEVDGVLDPIQQGFHELHALQCGFCTPGMLMTTRALLDENPDPTEQEIRTAISGAICRCTGYKNIVAAVRWAADHEAAGDDEQGCEQGARETGVHSGSWPGDG